MVITTSSLFMPTASVFTYICACVPPATASVFTYICACVKVIERAFVYLQSHSAKMRVELIVLMLFVCMTVGEFFSTYSNDKLCVVSRVAGKDVEINILRGVSYTLQYLNGSYSWNVSIKGLMEDFVGSMGPQRIIEGTDATNGLVLKCVVDGVVKLQANITVNSEKIKLN